jgi:hypothetical protein
MLVMLLVFAGIIAGLFVGVHAGITTTRFQAIESNAGRWVLVNEKTGETKWEWTGRVP